MEKLITFYDKERAVSYATGENLKKSTVVAQIRKMKAKKEIASYTINKTVAGKEFVIKTVDDTTTKILMTNSDPYAESLKNILKIREVAIMKVKPVYKEDTNQPEEIVSIAAHGEVEQDATKSIYEVAKFLEQMKKNDEIESVVKRTIKKDGKKMLVYTIMLEEEKIKIYMKEDSRLVDFMDNTLQKSSITSPVITEHMVETRPHHRDTKKKIGIALAVGAVALTLTSPYTKGVITKTYTNVKTTVSNSIEANRLHQEIMSNWPMLESYYTRLKTDDLSHNEYDDFKDLLYETMSYYEESGKTDEEDYQTLLEYRNLVTEKSKKMLTRPYR
jgi:hypothetical protein